MTPRIITADEARVLREAATPGPWRVTDYDTVAPSIGCGGWDIAVVHGDDDGRPWDADDSEPVAPLPLSDAALIAAAPDLAASVVALHAEVERARRFERIRVAEWMRGKIKAGLAEFANDPQAKAFFLGLIAYANAIDSNRMDP